MRKPKLTQEVVDKAVELKRDGLNDADIIAALGIAPSTFYRWLAEPDNQLKRALKEGLKKAEADYKRVLLSTIRDAAIARNGNWTAAAWLLERKYPEDYSLNRRRADEQADVPQIVLGVSVGRVDGEGDVAVRAIGAGAGAAAAVAVAPGGCAAAGADGAPQGAPEPPAELYDFEVADACGGAGGEGRDDGD